MTASVPGEVALATGRRAAYSGHMTRLEHLGLCVSLAALAVGAVQAQSIQNNQTATAVAANMTGVTGQGRGITAVTRRTVMSAPGQVANGFFAAGGVNVGPTANVPVPVAAPVAPVVAANPSGLERPDVQAALRQLAASGNVEARQLLKPSTPSTAAAAAAPAR